MSMYQFTRESRNALERMALPLAFFQNTDGKNLPLLISDGFCSLLGIQR